MYKRQEQHQRGHGEDLVIAALEVEHQVTILPEFEHGPEQERGPDDQGLSDEQDQRTNWVIDVKEPDQLGLGSSTSTGGCKTFKDHHLDLSRLNSLRKNSFLSNNRHRSG